MPEFRPVVDDGMAGYRQPNFGLTPMIPENLEMVVSTGALAREFFTPAASRNLACCSSCYASIKQQPGGLMKYIEWLCWGIVAVFAVADVYWILLDLFKLWGWEKPNAGDWAAWVQAIGSIAAIAGAFWIGERQATAATKTALQVQANEIAQKKAAILAIAANARVHAEQIRQAFLLDNDVVNALAVLLVFNKRMFSDLIDAIAAVPLHDLGSFQAVDALLKIKGECIFLMEKVERILYSSAGLQELQQGQPRDIRNEKARIRTSCNGIVAEYHRLAAALGA